MKKNTDTNVIMKQMVRCGMLLVGAVCNAAAIGLLLDPNQLAPGGVTGIAIMLNTLLDIPTGTIIFILNVPILAVGAWRLGWRFTWKTIVTVMISSGLVDVFSAFGPVTEDRMLAAIAGGSLLAFSMGIIFRAGATTGGIDIIVRLIKKAYPHIKTGKIFLVLDSVIVILSVFVFGNLESGIYAGLAVVVASNVIDFVLYGRDEAKLLLVISHADRTIANRFMQELSVGVTYVNGEGAYEEQARDIILCVMRKQLYYKALTIVKEEDPNAFLIVTSATEVFGEGFKLSDRTEYI